MMAAERAPFRCELWVDGHPLGPNSRATLRERLRDKRHDRETVAWLCMEHWHRLDGQRPLERARVTLTLVRLRGQPRDLDNAIASLKHCIDGLTVAGGGCLLVDDAPEHIELVVQQERGVRRGVRIVVEEVVM